MLVAAAAWDTLATGIRSAAASYGSVIASLATQGWLGPSSISMATAATPYAAWLNRTAGQAEETAVKATAAAEAFYSAFAMTRPPPVNGLVSGSYVSPALISPAITSALADLNSLQYDSVEVMIPPTLGDGLIPGFISPAGPPAAGLLGLENAAVTAGLAHPRR